jgi:hypothetical protein
LFAWIVLGPRLGVGRVGGGEGRVGFGGEGGLPLKSFLTSSTPSLIAFPPTFLTTAPAPPMYSRSSTGSARPLAFGLSQMFSQASV